MRLDLISKAFRRARGAGRAVAEGARRGWRSWTLGHREIDAAAHPCRADRDYRGTAGGRRAGAVVFQEPVLLPWRDALANITIRPAATAPRRDGWRRSGWPAKVPQPVPGQPADGAGPRLRKPRHPLMDEPFASLDGGRGAG